MGESWELSDRTTAESIVLDGALHGTGLRHLMERNPVALAGTVPVDGRFPLLYKFISAKENLSVQVHPGSGSGLGEPKTECWYVIDAEPGAELIVGIRDDGGTRESVLAVLKSPDCERVLQRLPARRGDVFFIPAGTVHAITGGVLLYEVQQNSDTTFRLYDWGRVDSEGKPRALHVDEAAQVADLTPRTGYAIPAVRTPQETHAEEWLVACPHFVLMKWSGFRAPARLATNGRFRVISTVSGTLMVEDETGEVVRLGKGETMLVPACHASVLIRGDSRAECIISFVPEVREDVLEPLRRAGVPTDQVSRLFGPPGIQV